jgi:hypothetical protein
LTVVSLLIIMDNIRGTIKNAKIYSCFNQKIKEEGPCHEKKTAGRYPLKGDTEYTRSRGTFEGYNADDKKLYIFRQAASPKNPGRASSYPPAGPAEHWFCY